MSNYVEIANLAATFIGTTARLVSPDDNTVLARRVKAVWDLQRRSTIRDGEWNFACARASLPSLAEVAPYPFTYVFALPAGTLRLLEVLDSEARDNYRLEGGAVIGGVATSGPRILANLVPINVRYLVDVPDMTLWDEQFAEAFAARIAWAIGKPIAGSAYSTTEGWNLYQAKCSAAKSVDARENPPLDQEESGWVLARWGWFGNDMNRGW
jgi:hypothetical protein